MVDSMERSSARQPVAPGTLLAGKYRVDKVLGEGGMGIVVRAHHEVLQQQVALKFLLPEAVTSSEAVERFLREARAAVRIQSEHVARIIDVGTLENGSPFMVMELLEGGDLSSVIASGRGLPVPRAVDFLLEALDAIAEAHALGIVHRDLKPSNLFLANRADGSSVVKVLDFGISKVQFGSESTGPQNLTSTMAVMGSPLYMSPEQFKSSKRVDGRSDLWSLGVILYELLVGRPPFNGESVGEVFANVIEQEPLPVRQLRPDIPPGLEQVVMRCLRKKPAERFAHAGELAEALGPFSSGRSMKNIERAMHLSTRGSVSRLTGPDGSGPQVVAQTAYVLGKMPSPVAQTAGSWTSGSLSNKLGKSRGLFVGVAAAVGTALVGSVIAVVVVLQSRVHRTEGGHGADAPPSALIVASPPVPSGVAPLTGTTPVTTGVIPTGVVPTGGPVASAPLPGPSTRPGQTGHRPPGTPTGRTPPGALGPAAGQTAAPATPSAKPAGASSADIFSNRL